jgi:hypothetical protein
VSRSGRDALRSVARNLWPKSDESGKENAHSDNNKTSGIVGGYANSAPELARGARLCAR